MGIIAAQSIGEARHAADLRTFHWRVRPAPTLSSAVCPAPSSSSRLGRRRARPPLPRTSGVVLGEDGQGRSRSWPTTAPRIGALIVERERLRRSWRRREIRPRRAGRGPRRSQECSRSRASAPTQHVPRRARSRRCTAIRACRSTTSNIEADRPPDDPPGRRARQPGESDFLPGSAPTSSVRRRQPTGSSTRASAPAEGASRADGHHQGARWPPTAVLPAASFQETTRASPRRRSSPGPTCLVLKENIIIGKAHPGGTGMPTATSRPTPRLPADGVLLLRRRGARQCSVVAGQR